MNFALIANSVPESETMVGGYRIAIECAKRWLACGHRVTFFTNRLGKAMISRYIPEGEVDFIQTALPPGMGGKALTSLIVAAFFYPYMAVAGAFTTRRAALLPGTVIYSNSPFWPDIFPALLMRWRFPDSRLLVAMSMYAPPFWKSWKAYAKRKWSIPEPRALAHYLNQLSVYSLIRRYCDGIFVNNELDLARAIEDGFSPNNVGVVGMGVDNELARQVPGPDGITYDAVFIGRLHPQKGVLELIDIWRLFADKHPKSRLAIIGNGPLEEKLRVKIEKSGLQGQVDMLGFLDGPEKIRIFKASRIAIHCSLYDSGGMATLEAMSCGLPGVSYDLPDLATYYPQGMLKVPCYDLGAFAASIERLLEDAELYQRLHEEALDWAQKWDWDIMAEKLLELMERLFD